MPFCANCGNDVLATDAKCNACYSDLTKEGAKAEQPPAQPSGQNSYSFHWSEASSAGQNTGVQPTKVAGSGTPQAQPPLLSSMASFHAELGPGERIVWQRDLKRGIIHRHVSTQERITNKRIFLYDFDNQRFSQVLMNENFDVVVANSRRNSASVGGGRYGGGVFYGVRSGSSRTVGDLEIMEDGLCRIRMTNVIDPHGVKSLIDAVKRETRTVGRLGYRPR